MKKLSVLIVLLQFAAANIHLPVAQAVDSQLAEADGSDDVGDHAAKSSGGGYSSPSPRPSPSYSSPSPRPSPAVPTHSQAQPRGADGRFVSKDASAKTSAQLPPSAVARGSQARDPQTGRFVGKDKVVGADKHGNPVAHENAVVVRGANGKSDYVRDRKGNIVTRDNPNLNAHIARANTNKFMTTGGAGKSTPGSFGTATSNSAKSTVINNTTVNNVTNYRTYGSTYGGSYGSGIGFFEGYLIGSVMASAYHPYYYGGWYPGCFGWCGSYYYAPPVNYGGTVNVIVNGQMQSVPANSTIVVQQQQQAVADGKVGKPPLTDEQRLQMEQHFKIKGTIEKGDFIKVPEEQTVRLKSDAGEGDAKMVAGSKCFISYHGTLVVESVSGDKAVVTYVPAEKPEANSLECPTSAKIEVDAHALSTYNQLFVDNVKRDMKEGDEQVAPASIPQQQAQTATVADNRSWWTRTFGSFFGHKESDSNPAMIDGPASAKRAPGSNTDGDGHATESKEAR